MLKIYTIGQIVELIAPVPLLAGVAVPKGAIGIVIHDRIYSSEHVVVEFEIEGRWQSFAFKDSHISYYLDVPEVEIVEFAEDYEPKFMKPFEMTPAREAQLKRLLAQAKPIKANPTRAL